MYSATTHGARLLPQHPSPFPKPCPITSLLFVAAKLGNTGLGVKVVVPAQSMSVTCSALALFPEQGPFGRTGKDRVVSHTRKTTYLSVAHCMM